MPVLIVTEHLGLRLDRWLALNFPDRARNQIQQDIESGLVRVDGMTRPASHKVREGESVAYEPALPPVEELIPEPIPLNIVFEDDCMLVVDKPAGLVVHPAPGHASGTLANALLAHCGPTLKGVGGENRWGIVHRLDALTSGLMLAAKTQPAYEALVAALAERRITRQYLGLALGSFSSEQGSIDQAIARRRSDRKRMGVVDPRRAARYGEPGRDARTDWQLICQLDGLALLGLRLHTGRTHQIRVHLQAIGRPILGDPEYGWTKQRTLQHLPQALRARVAGAWPGRQLLHAARLSLAHPLKPASDLRFSSLPPADFERMLGIVFAELHKSKLKEWLETEPTDLPTEPPA